MRRKETVEIARFAGYEEQEDVEKWDIFIAQYTESHILCSVEALLLLSSFSLTYFVNGTVTLYVVRPRYCVVRPRLREWRRDL